MWYSSSNAVEHLGHLRNFLLVCLWSSAGGGDQRGPRHQSNPSHHHHHQLKHTHTQGQHEPVDELASAPIEEQLEISHAREQVDAFALTQQHEQVVLVVVVEMGGDGLVETRKQEWVMEAGQW